MAEIANFQDKLRSLFNGPPLAGIGATADKGLLPSTYHILPYAADINSVTALDYKPGTATVHPSWDIPTVNSFAHLDVDTLIRYAKYNVNSVYGLDNHIRDVVAADPSFGPLVTHDLMSIYILMAGCNLYYTECRAATAAELTAIQAIQVTDTDRAVLVSAEQMNRAATFIMARAHTKYQTNHAVGGSPAQGSMGATLRWAYDISVLQSSNVTTTAKARAATSAVYWALHPLNEPATIPFIVEGSKITSAKFHTAGPPPVIPVADEFFRIRRKVAPASAHNFGLCVAAMSLLSPLGILAHFPEQVRFKLLINGFQLVEAHGARLHPAAHFWGLERVSANQKDIETLVQDLGYAVTRLFPLTTLAKAPAFSRTDVVSTVWKTLIDALKVKMDEEGSKLLDDATFQSIQKQIAPPSEVSTTLTRALALSSGTTDKTCVVAHRFVAFEDMASEAFFHDDGEDGDTPTYINPDGEVAFNCEILHRGTDIWTARSAIIEKRVLVKAGRTREGPDGKSVTMPRFFDNTPFASITHILPREAVPAGSAKGTAATKAVEESWSTATFHFFARDISHETEASVSLKNGIILRPDGAGILVDAAGNEFYEIEM